MPPLSNFITPPRSFCPESAGQCRKMRRCRPKTVPPPSAGTAPDCRPPDCRRCHRGCRRPEAGTYSCAPYLCIRGSTVSNIPNCDRKCNPRARNYAVTANQPAGWCAHLLAMTGFSTRPPHTPEGCAFMVRATGLDRIFVLPPSSRRQATPHRGVAFRWVRVRCLFSNKKEGA